MNKRVPIAQHAPRLTPAEIRTILLSTKGLIFHVTFVKRSNNQIRRMTARINVHKNQAALRHDPTRKDRDQRNNLLTVYEMDGPRSGYKCIPLDGIIDLRAPQPEKKETGPKLRPMSEIIKEQWDYIEERKRNK